MASQPPDPHAITPRPPTPIRRGWDPSRHGFLLLPGDGLVLVSDALAVLHLDRTARALFGSHAGQLEQAHLPAVWPELADLIATHRDDLEQGPLDLDLPSPQGQLNLRLFRTDDGVGVGLLAQAAAEASTELRLRLFEGLLNTIQDALLITLAEPMDRPGPIIVYANETLLRETGFSSEEVLGRSPRLFQGPDTDHTVTAEFGAALRRWESPTMEVLNYDRAGNPYWIELKVAPFADSDGWFTHWVSVQRDVSDRRAGEQALAQQALSDPLTGLPNRRGLAERLDLALARLQRRPGLLALIFCDLDRFKEVNDRYGHATGDALLLELTRRLQTVLRSNDTLARLGGDEFVVLVETMASEDDAVQLAQRLQACLAEPWRHGGEELSLSMSMGVAMSTHGRTSAEELMRRADLTMYQVKVAGRDGVAVYDADVDQAVQASVSLRQQLEQGLRHDRLLLHYQPIVNLEDGTILGAEALVRLQGSDGDLIAPDRFIPMAERTGLIVPMERWVLSRAIDTLREWQRQGKSWQMSINVSLYHLETATLVQELLEQRERTGVDLAGLRIEVTETVLLREHAQAFHDLSVLKQAGVTIALDDFGTGYSSLSWLSQLPVDIVKLDQSYIRQIDDDPRCATLIGGFVRVFKELGLLVVAEGIETEGQRQLLLAMGCQVGQGYLFGRPAPLADWTSGPG
ncbi:putative bifunctional diguanylate cyclase/phosphodiesterase [Vulcanococcus limneticus]|uniref:putative bifunctional diguanylate cyclase/phosphodiesterase n=1 Tax=Vulcanococcus limneticus TaxID=2170428 RepID=UPI00398C0DE7